MAVDMFITFGKDINGSTQDKAQKGNCDVLAFSWGMSQSGSFHAGSGGGAGKVSVQDLSLTKYVDTASAALMMHCCTGKHMPVVTLLIRNAGGTIDKPGEKQIEITMTKVMVTSVSTGGSGGEDRFTENITLNFAEVKYEFTPQTATGVPGAASNLSWNIAENTGSTK